MTYSQTFCILLLFECTLLAFSKNVTDKDNIKFTMQLIEEGDKRIEINYDDVVLTLGNTGSGKSTLINFIANDISRLYAKKFGNSIIIEDLDNKISKVEDTIVSKTLFPELIFDSSSGTAYYDCSGFSDTRNSSIDIASNYFIRKIITSVGRLKILFVVNYSSVTIGNDRQDFMILLRHATDFMKNLKHLNGSIALIVTKVEKIVKDDGNYRLQTDQEEINQIAKFLTTVKSAIEKNLPNELDENKKRFHEKALTLLEIFSLNVNGIYPNIGIFRKPDDEGALSNIKLMKQNRVFLKEIIEEHLIYSTVDSEDFGYTVSATSRNFIHDLISEMNEKFNYETNQIIKKVISHYYDKERTELNDLDSFKKDLIELYDDIQRIFDIFNNDFVPEIFSTEITTLFEKFRMPLPKENLKNIKNYSDFLNFLNDVNSQPLNINSGYIMQKWKLNLEKLNELKNIYVFFSNLNGKLTEYKIQKNKEDFDVATLSSKISQDLAENIPINGNYFNEILNQIYIDEIKGDYNLDSLNNIKNTTFNKIQVQLLMKIFEITLKSSTRIECYDQKLIVSGENVLLSQILNTCSDWTLLKIYAANKIFIDEDIIKTGRYVRVIIIAPIWEVINKREILLIGNSADDFYYLILEKQKPGENGHPGKPGFYGGSLFGMGYIFTNSKNLVITSKGGDGGTGQSGAKGANGQDGYVESMYEADQDNFYILIWNKMDTYYKQYHRMGSNGGHGGHGGAGGLPGKAGEVDIIGLEEQPEIKLIDGEIGPAGSGGGGGVGGLGHYICYLTRYYRTVLIIPYTDNTVKNCGTPMRSQSGESGITGLNHENMAAPKKNNIEDKESYVNEFNKFISKDLTDPIKNKKSLKHFQKIYNENGALTLHEDL